MDTIDDNFASSPKDFVLLKKTLFYTFFSFIYFMLFNFQDLGNEVEAQQLTPESVGKIKLVNERLKNRTAPQPVLESTDRRTTNPKERKELFNYLKHQLENA
jgi:hypothetical protein